DEYGVPRAEIEFEPSAADRERAKNMCARIENVASALNAEFITERFPLEFVEPQFDKLRHIEVMASGRSYHEAGTLRLGTSPTFSACDLTGRLHGMENLFIADASLFPCVGVANPILTASALARWV